MDSDSWTSIGKGGKAIRGGGSISSSEFPSGAAAAFGGGGRRGGWDRGSRWSGDGDRTDHSDRTYSNNRSGFSESASAAFGGRRPSGSGSGGGGSGHYVPPSSRRPAAAPAPAPNPAAALAAQPFEDAFPTLGRSAGAPVAKPAAVVPTTAAPGALSFASLVKKTAEEEAAAEEIRRYHALRDADARKAEERERRLLTTIRSRTSYGAEYKPSNYEEEDYGGGYDDDLDHDVYGARTTTVYGGVPDVREDDDYSDHRRSFDNEDDY